MSRSQACIKRRAIAWEWHFIPCRNHPDRRCQRSSYVQRRIKQCSSCSHHKADGSLRGSFLRANVKVVNRWRENNREHRNSLYRGYTRKKRILAGLA